MESYYNEYFQGRQAAPSNNNMQDENNNTHYQASNMMSAQNGRYNRQE